MRKFIIIIAVMFVTACSSTPPSEYPDSPGADYMTASWYGAKFHGRPTSSGERYDMHGMTAAHKTLKFGTKLKVTNPDTGKSVLVTVNDRGPFIRGRDLDLSYGAAKEIGLIERGVGRVEIEHLGRDMRYVKRVPFTPGAGGSLTIQVGSFIDESRALRLKQGLEISYDDVHITTVILKGKKYRRVRVGEFSKYEDAFNVAKKLADEGYQALIMKKR